MARTMGHNEREMAENRKKIEDRKIEREDELIQELSMIDKFRREKSLNIQDRLGTTSEYEIFQEFKKDYPEPTKKAQELVDELISEQSTLMYYEGNRKWMEERPEEQFAQEEGEFVFRDRLFSAIIAEDYQDVKEMVKTGTLEHDYGYAEDGLNKNAFPTVFFPTDPNDNTGVERKISHQPETTIDSTINFFKEKDNIKEQVEKAEKWKDLKEGIMRDQGIFPKEDKPKVKNGMKP